MSSYQKGFDFILADSWPPMLQCYPHAAPSNVRLRDLLYPMLKHVRDTCFPEGHSQLDEMLSWKLREFVLKHCDLGRGLLVTRPLPEDMVYSLDTSDIPDNRRRWV